jgi:hypothetical protein
MGVDGEGDATQGMHPNQHPTPEVGSFGMTPRGWSTVRRGMSHVGRSASVLRRARSRGGDEVMGVEPREAQAPKFSHPTKIAPPASEAQRQ